jgi:hypothetical protein
LCFSWGWIPDLYCWYCVLAGAVYIVGTVYCVLAGAVYIDGIVF